jgi:uncharacterized protein (TIGR03437 family)
MHKRFARLLAVTLFSTVAALAQPAVSVAISSAVARGPGMPGSGIAQGSIFTIYGSGLGPTSGVAASAFPLPTVLGGTSVAVTVRGTQVSAIILFSASYQINAILPSTTPVGSGTFTVTCNGQTSAPAAIQVVSSAFGIYAYSSQGTGQAIATDVNYNLNTIIHTFHPGDYGILWGTGLGAIHGSDAALPPVGNLPTPIKVYVGNTTASINYQGRSGCCAGLDQIVFQIPAGVTGCYVPIGVEAGGVLGNIGNITTIAISDSGQTCSDSVMGKDLVNMLAAGQTVDFGYFRLESELSSYIPGSAGKASLDAAMATFSEYTPATAGLAEYGVSSGYCVAVDCSYGCPGVNTYNYSLQDSSPAQLDAGTVSVQYAPVVTLNQAQYALGSYGVFLSEIERYLWSGLTYPVAGTGGAAVGPFSANDLTSIPGMYFTGISNAQNLPRASDLTLQWTGGNPTLQNGQVTIGVYSGSSDFTQWEALQCTAPLSPGQFTIPAWVLSLLPPSGTGVNSVLTYPLGWIWIGQYNNPTTFSATGLTKGIVADIFYNGIGVFFQ